MAASVAEKTAAPVAPEAALAPKKSISSANVELAGQVFTEYAITLPPGWSLQDLDDPKIWKQVQGGATPFRTLDRLNIVDFELTWYVMAIVAAATDGGAAISIIKKCNLPARDQNLPSIEDWRVAFHGRGFAVVNKLRGHNTGIIFSSLSEATAAMYRQVPRIVQ